MNPFTIYKVKNAPAGLEPATPLFSKVGALPVEPTSESLLGKIGDESRDSPGDQSVLWRQQGVQAPHGVRLEQSEEVVCVGHAQVAVEELEPGQRLDRHLEDVQPPGQQEGVQGGEAAHVGVHVLEDVG